MRSPEQTSSNTALIQRYLQYLRLERRYSENSVAAVKRDLALIAQAVDVVTSQDLKLLLAKRHTNGSAPASLARTASSWRGFFLFFAERAAHSSQPGVGAKNPQSSQSHCPRPSVLINCSHCSKGTCLSSFGSPKLMC